MINTGYLFSKDNNRLFVNTSLGCSANCSYCYLPTLKYSKGKEVDSYITAEELIKQVEDYKDFREGREGTLVSFGCYSECWDDTNKEQTKKLIKYFLEKGNQVQFSTKRYVDYNELLEISKEIKYKGQLVIFVSSVTITDWEKFENNTTSPDKRFKSFEITEKLDIPVVLYIKPVLYNVTIKDVNKYIELIKKYNIKNVVVGSIIKTTGTGIVAPFVDDDSMHAAPIEQENEIIELLSSYATIYKRSTEVLKQYK